MQGTGDIGEEKKKVVPPNGAILQLAKISSSTLRL